jgi:hypothetical protein
MDNETKEKKVPMRTFIGTKIIKAKPMTNHEFDGSHSKPVDSDLDAANGYLVQYADADGVFGETPYEAWSPKDVFEKAYLSMRDSDGSKITLSMVEDFIETRDVVTMGDKTTVVQATLRNGFVITESSSCVDPANYDKDVGEKICMDRIQNKVWELLGFMLQTAISGVQVHTM